MFMTSYTEDYIENAIYKILSSRPCKAIEIRFLLKEKGIMISYGRLKRILNEMIASGRIKRATKGTSIIYYI